MEYQKNFSLIAAYAFLKEHGFEKEAEEIRISPDQFKSYHTTLRRAKIITLVRDNKLLDDFYQKVWTSGLTDRGKTRTKFFENLVVRFKNDQDGIAPEGEDEEEEVIVQEENEFAYENDLRNYLVRNLNVIEKGLRLYEAAGVNGEEFYIPGTARRIDILAVDRNGKFVVIELKVSRGYEKVIGQTLFYQSSIKTSFNQVKVRVIIIARDISEEIKVAAQFLPDFELFEYQLSLSLKKIK